MRRIRAGSVSRAVTRTTILPLQASPCRVAGSVRARAAARRGCVAWRQLETSTGAGRVAESGLQQPECRKDDRERKATWVPDWRCSSDELAPSSRRRSGDLRRVGPLQPEGPVRVRQGSAGAGAWEASHRGPAEAPHCLGEPVIIRPSDLKRPTKVPLAGAGASATAGHHQADPGGVASRKHRAGGSLPDTAISATDIPPTHTRGDTA